MTITIRTVLLVLAMSAADNMAAAQAGQPGQSRPPEQPEQDFSRYLFPPELIMQFQQKINLQPDQRTSITQAIQQMQSRVIDLQWQMQAEVQKLTEIMQAPTIKETEALAQVDRVLGIERDVKRAHLGALIRIKNTLTSEQQAKASALRDGLSPDSGTIRFRVDPTTADVRAGGRLLGVGVGQTRLPVGPQVLSIRAPGCAVREIPVMIMKDELVTLLPPQTKLVCR